MWERLQEAERARVDAGPLHVGLRRRQAALQPVQVGAKVGAWAAAAGMRFLDQLERGLLQRRARGRFQLGRLQHALHAVRASHTGARAAWLCTA